MGKMLLCVLVVALPTVLCSCVTGGYRELGVNRDAKTGNLVNLKYREEGTDTKANSVKIRAPGGWQLDVNGLDSNQSNIGILQLQLLLAQTQLASQALAIAGGKLGVSVPMPTPSPIVIPTTQPAK